MRAANINVQLAGSGTDTGAKTAMPPFGALGIAGDAAERHEDFASDRIDRYRVVAGSQSAIASR